MEQDNDNLSLQPLHLRPHPRLGARAAVAQEVERVDRKVAGSIPGSSSSSLSVKVSLSERQLTLTAPDELAVALGG